MPNALLNIKVITLSAVIPAKSGIQSTRLGEEHGLRTFKSLDVRASSNAVERWQGHLLDSRLHGQDGSWCGN